MQYLVKISSNNNKMDIFIIYTERAIEKCQRWNFLTPLRQRNSKNKSMYSFAGHLVVNILVIHLKFCNIKNGRVVVKFTPKS